MSIQVNIPKIYLNNDRTLKNKYDAFISRGADNTVVIMLVAPFNILNSMYINFQLENEIEVPTRYMTLVGTENSDETGNEDWGVWKYTLGQKILNGAASNQAQNLGVSFSEFRNITDSSTYDFIGFQSTLAELETNFPSPTDNQYVGVGNGTTIGTSTCYLAVGGVWVSQEKTVYQFESDEDILREQYVGESVIVELSIDPNINTTADEVDNTNLDVIFRDISILNGTLLMMSMLLGSDGENFVKSEIISEYAERSTLESEDVFYVFTAEGQKRHVLFSNLLEGSREVFVGRFITASGLTCPDENDLICTYPNGIVDPDTRLGWVASVESTGTLWKWLTSQNEWQDSGLAATEAKDITYDSSSDGATNETNVQDAMVEHGQKIAAAGTDVDVLENKTQNLDENGDIVENIIIANTKDIASNDLSTGTSGTYGTVIQALVAEYLRNETQDEDISINAGEIAARLVKDFSSLTAKSTPSNGDLLSLYDGATNKSISWQDLVSAIETTLINDQGYFTSIESLRIAIPVGEPGWFASIGDEDYIAVWDVETSDWIESSQKLTYSQSEGEALELRVTTNESDISSIQINLLGKESVSNKKTNAVGNETDENAYLNVPAILALFDIRDDDIQDNTTDINETRKYNTVVQSNQFITRNARNSTLFDGRIEHIFINGGVTQYDGIAQFSINGGSTYKNVVVFNVDTESFVDLNLSIGIVYGTRFKLTYSASLDKWIAVDSNEDLERVRGAGWLPIMTVATNYLKNETQDIRLDNIESNPSEPTLQEVRITSDIEVTTNTIAHELLFNETSIPSNNTDVLDVDANFNHIVKDDSEPGVEFNFYSQITNIGSLNSTAEITFRLVNKSAPVTAGDFVVGQKYIINSVGTTDFTAIGASGNTVGVIFTATGVGTGTGSALSVFRDIKVISVGQNTQTDRAIVITLANEDYTTPFTMGVYYTLDDSLVEINKCVLNLKTLFPTGTGPSSSETTILTDIAAETRDGTKTKQSEHNVESVTDRKNLLESGKIIVANHQTAGQFMANKPEIDLITNKIVTVFFSGGDDVTDLVELSLDNGSNYYDVEFRDTNVDLTVKDVIVAPLYLYFTGSKFILSNTNFYNNASSNLNATNYQDAIDELATRDMATEYGVREVVDQSDSTFERVKKVGGVTYYGTDTNLVANVGVDDEIVENSFDDIPIFARERVTVTSDDGVNQQDNVFVKVKKYYIKEEWVTESTIDYHYIWMSPYKLDGYRTPQPFIKEDGTERDFVYLSAYEGFVDSNNILRSKSGELPSHSKTRAQFRTYARNNDTGDSTSVYLLSDIQEVVDLIQIPIWIEFADKDSQTAIGRGVVDLTFDATTVADGTTTTAIVSNSEGANFDIDMTVYVNSEYFTIQSIDIDTPVAGQTTITFNETASSAILNGANLDPRQYKTGLCDSVVASTGFYKANDGKHPFIWRGMENVWGNIWKFIDGIKISDHYSWIATDYTQYNDDASDVNGDYTSPYVKLNYQNSLSNGYIKELGYDSLYPFAKTPTLIGAGSSTYYADYYYQNTGDRVAFLGGRWAGSSYAGLSSWGFYDSLSDAGSSFSARLSYRP